MTFELPQEICLDINRGLTIWLTLAIKIHTELIYFNNMKKYQAYRVVLN